MGFYKKIIILILSLSFICMPIFAEEGDFDGYIVKYRDNDRIYVVDEPPMALLGMDSEIEFIAPDYKLELHGTPRDPYCVMQWSLKAIKVPALWAEEIYGKDVKVAVIDSGVTDHGELTHCLLPGKNCIDKAADINDVTDQNGHGTFVSGIIAAAWNDIGTAGIAPEAKIIPYKVVEGNSAPTSAVFTALDNALSDNCKIINMSLGMKESAIKSEEIMNLWKQKINALKNNGAIIIASVGNYGSSDRYIPAAFDNVIGVGAMYKDANNRITHAPYSQVNDSVFVMAPGGAVLKDASGNITYEDRIISTSYLGTTPLGNTGTSFSAPMVSAMAALMAEKHPSLNHEMFERVLMLTSDNVGAMGYDTTYGFGFINGAKMAGLESGEINNILNCDFALASEKLNDYTSVTMCNFASAEKTIQIINFAFDGDKKLDKLTVRKHKIGPNNSIEIKFAADGGKAFIVDGDILDPVEVIEK